MIESFRHKGLQRLFEKADRSKVSAQDVQKLEHILAVLNHAKKPEDMGLPGFLLHPPQGQYERFLVSHPTGKLASGLHDQER
jgi:proteic killer suppression protein